MYLPSRLYSIKVSQVNGDKWAASGDLRLSMVRRFLKRKRKEYGDIKIEYLTRVSDDFALYN